MKKDLDNVVYIDFCSCDSRGVICPHKPVELWNISELEYTPTYLQTESLSEDITEGVSVDFILTELEFLAPLCFLAAIVTCCGIFILTFSFVMILLLNLG